LTAHARQARTEPGDKGRLQWHRLLQWLRDDGLISPTDAERVVRRFGAGDSSLHALIRLGGAGLVETASGRRLDTEALTEWMAQRLVLDYLRIDRSAVDGHHPADKAAHAPGRAGREDGPDLPGRAR